MHNHSSNSATYLKLLRHFDKTHASGKLTWRIDVETSTHGLEKTHIFAQYYAHEFDGYHILSSQSRRCTELVDILRDYNDIASATILWSLIERDYGIFQGMKKHLVVEHLKQLFASQAQDIGDNLTAWLDQELYTQDGKLVFESTLQLKKRIIEELFYQFSRLEGENILFVGHTGTIRALLTTFMDISNLELDTLLAQRDGRAHIIYGALQIIDEGVLRAVNDIPDDLAQLLGYKL